MSKEIKKRWTDFIKSKTKDSAWKFKSYFIFKVEGPFLFDSMFWINGKTNSLTGVLHFKFAAIDDLFWELTLDHDNPKNRPLSLRVEGSYIVRPIRYYDFSLTDITENKLVDLLATIDDKIKEIKERFSAEDNYLKYIRENKVLNEYSYLTNLLFFKKYNELLFFIEYCRKNNITSGISLTRNGISEDYFDRLTKYIGAIS